MKIVPVLYKWAIEGVHEMELVGAFQLSDVDDLSHLHALSAGRRPFDRLDLETAQGEDLGQLLDRYVEGDVLGEPRIGDAHQGAPL